MNTTGLLDIAGLEVSAKEVNERNVKLGAELQKERSKNAAWACGYADQMLEIIELKSEIARLTAELEAK